VVVAIVPIVEVVVIGSADSSLVDLAVQLSSAVGTVVVAAADIGTETAVVAAADHKVDIVVTEVVSVSMNFSQDRPWDCTLGILAQLRLE